MKTAKGFPAVVASFCIILLCLYAAVCIPAFNLSFYGYEYEKNGTAAIINIEQPELMRVTKHMLDYMKGKEPGLQISAVVGGVETDYFSQREIDHMKDVKALFDKGRIIAFAAVLGLCLSAATLWLGGENPLMEIARYCRFVIGVFTAAMVVLWVAVTLNFDKAFVLFHEIFFNNDLWILDPAVSRLLNMVPQPFFTDVFALAAAIFAVLLVAVTAASSLIVRGEKK